jgi:hypothetical protein
MRRLVDEAAAVGTPGDAQSKQDRKNDSEARSQVQAAVMADVIRRVVDAAPRLTPEQRDRLAVLLQGHGAAR